MPGKGFASMPPALRKQIAARGGRIAHEQGKAHEWTPAEAKKAGEIGGKRSSRKVTV